MDAGANAFGKLREDRQEEIIVIGQQNAHKGALIWTKATDEEKRKRKEAGAAAFGNMTEERQQEIILKGASTFLFPWIILFKDFYVFL